VSGYEDLIAAAEADYHENRFKEAHINYGRALSAGGDCDYYCRRMRGVCSRLVGEQRLEKAAEQPEEFVLFLNQAAKWLAKSEANLDSALEHAPESERGAIRLEQARTEETIARFMRLSGGDPERRLSAARSHRAEGLELQPRH
jgi:hypothetical protein